ncbi:hypothetical protein FPL22_08080 [Rariglobus hedericola]|uniref:Uncharacterized protein n=1 Tax=Rariglobus hedericola TaxID=2597822 RepID=A0A556QSY1_9BACT|nr:hypothetical protein FPL22_08080 [Rariglobus hedericola]
MSTPTAAHVDFTDETLLKFNSSLCSTLFRYLAGNPRWEIREERGLKYAVRLELVNGTYETTLNGFYSSSDYENYHQTRVLLSFGRPYGFGVERGNTTKVRPGAKDVPLTIEAEHAGTPGNSSYAIIEGAGFFLEIYDQAPGLRREFTQAAFNEVCTELKDVLSYREEIDKTGVLPVPARYPAPLPVEKKFVVKDGMQPGIYLIDAAIAPTQQGFAYVKAFDVKTGARLSAQRMTPRTTRHVGWSNEGKSFFPYKSELTVYEGDWSHTYEARFELWHSPLKGPEMKLAEATRTINGWER